MSLRVLILSLLALLSGCAGLATERLAGGVSRAILDQDDPATVRDGAPAYLLLIDGLIADAAEDERLLIAGADLYGAYASVFVQDRERAVRLMAKARDYARRALCLRDAAICAALAGPYEGLVRALKAAKADVAPALYAYGAALAGTIQVQSGDWDALAELPKVEALMERVVALDERYQHGRAQLYLGVIRSQRPPALGGQPEAGRKHFERAIELSAGSDLIVQVEFARNYARLVFDRELHDTLLRQVLAADPHRAGLTLSNVLAQRQAQELLQQSEEFFGE